jgi:hypothetical protein
VVTLMPGLCLEPERASRRLSALTGDPPMKEYRTALVWFAVALFVAVAAAFATTFERVNTRKVSDDAPAGTIGLARHHEPLDRAPGVPITKDR